MCKCKNLLPITHEGAKIMNECCHLTDQATPRPWRIDSINFNYCRVLDNNGFTLIPKIHLAHAGLIVPAVNAYDKNQETIRELVEALQESLLVIKHNDNLGWGDVCSNHINKALNKAGQL